MLNNEELSKVIIEHFIQFYTSLYIRVFMREEKGECKFTIENKNELKKSIKTLEDAWDKIKIY